MSLRGAVGAGAHSRRGSTNFLHLAFLAGIRVPRVTGFCWDFLFLPVLTRVPVALLGVPMHWGPSERDTEPGVTTEAGVVRWRRVWVAATEALRV